MYCGLRVVETVMSTCHFLWIVSGGEFHICMFCHLLWIVSGGNCHVYMSFPVDCEWWRVSDLHILHSLNFKWRRLDVMSTCFLMSCRLWALETIMSACFTSCGFWVLEAFRCACFMFCGLWLAETVTSSLHNLSCPVDCEWWRLSCLHVLCPVDCEWWRLSYLHALCPVDCDWQRLSHQAYTICHVLWIVSGGDCHDYMLNVLCIASGRHYIIYYILQGHIYMFCYISGTWMISTTHHHVCLPRICQSHDFLWHGCI